MWSKIKLFFWKTRGVWIATPAITGLIISLRLAGLLQTWGWNVFDLYMRWRPLEERDERIAIVGINEQDVHKQNQAILTDDILAKLLNILKEQEPIAIGLDIYRDLPVPPGKDALESVFQTTPNLVGIQKVAGETGIETVAPPPTLKEKGQVGANDLIFDGDNRVRRGLISLNKDDETIYSFSLFLALHYLDRLGIAPQVSDDADQWTLGKASFKPFESDDGDYVNADDGGYQIMINYRGGNRHIETRSMTDILEGNVPPDWARDRIILIGKVGESFKDTFFTPYSGSLFATPEPVSGVEIHANLVSQIISAAVSDRPLIRTWSSPIEWVWILLWSGAGATISWSLRHTDANKVFSWHKWCAYLGLTTLLFGGTYVAFIQGWWIPVVPAFLAFMGSSVAITAYVARSAVEIRKTFGRYLTDQVVENLLENPSGLQLGGERRRITILTSDLRGFTATSERLPPEEVIKILNFYLGHMAEVINKYEGTIDEFMGDGILVLFGAPTAKPDDVKRAIACAIEMQLVMDTVNQQMRQWKMNKLEMGIGINTGEVVVGNIGSEKRTKYGIVGSQVNLTYRIESYTLGGQIFISESTLQEAEELLKIDEVKQVQPKGIPHPINIYSVIGIKDNYNLYLPQSEEVYYPLSQPLPLEYQVLKGKDMGETQFLANIIQLSENGALLSFHDSNGTQELPTTMSNLKLNLLPCDQNLESSDDIYAKVTRINKESQFYIRFTTKPPEIAAKLDSLYQSLTVGLTQP